MLQAQSSQLVGNAQSKSSINKSCKSKETRNIAAEKKLTYMKHYEKLETYSNIGVNLTLLNTVRLSS